MSYEPMSPVDVEQRLRTCVNDLWRAEKDLREARDAETDAEIQYRRAHRKAMLSSQCPAVTRGGTTTSERDAWVDDQAAVEWESYRAAQAKREAATDHVRATRDISSSVQSIAALVRQAYQVGGTS